MYFFSSTSFVFFFFRRRIIEISHMCIGFLTFLVNTSYYSIRSLGPPFPKSVISVCNHVPFVKVRLRAFAFDVIEGAVIVVNRSWIMCNRKRTVDFAFSIRFKRWTVKFSKWTSGFLFLRIPEKEKIAGEASKYRIFICVTWRSWFFFMFSMFI